MQNLKSSLKKNGLFVYYSHPKLVSDIRAEQLRQWTLSGEESKLERAILSGHGHRLMVETEALPLPQHLIQLVAKCDALHAAIEKGSLLELKNLLDNDYNRNKSVTCRDKAGVGLLHKAVFYNYMDIMEWLVKSYPHLVHQRDSAGRTALHYTAACRDEAAAAGLLERAGAARGARDAAGRTLAHYRAARTLLTLPAADMPQAARNPPGLVIKRHNIRIWCHECDMGRLQRVVWEGHGTRLLSEVSSQPIVKRFLEAVPYIMNTIRDIHQSVIQNDLEGLIKLTADPVSPQVFSSRDINGMTALHKAAGLGHCGILKYIIEKYPRGINEIDNDGRTSLHYAATVKDEQHTYSTLVGLGADESVVDNKNKSPGYYINRPQEIDKNIFKILPEAPRTPSSAYPLTWDWKLLEIEHLAETNKKNRKKNIKASNENISFKNNTNSTLSETTENQHSSMKNSSTHELINKLPELDDTEKFNTKIVEESTNEVSEIVDEKNLEENVHAVIKENDEINKDSLENITNDQYESINTNTETCRNSKETLTNNDYADKDEDVEQKSDNINTGELGHENVSDSCEVQKRCENSIDSNTANQDANSTDDGMSCDRNKDVFEHKDDSNNNDTKNNESEIINELEEYPEVQINNHSIVSTELTDLNKDQQNDQNFEVHNTSNGEFLKEKQETVARVSSPELTKYERIPEKSASTIALEGNNNSYHSEDDDDVQVQEKSNIETIETNFSLNPKVLEIDSTKEGNLDNGRLTQESLIEGIISGDAEQDSQDASITQKDEPIHGEILIVDNEIDPEVTSLINSANMEMLATLVLNGEGSRLIGRQSQNAELQSFLENVPTYMQKINRVHIAAKEGNIRDLQTALDRRKFAIARDPISPNGATPLHVATVYGKTNIIKYLGGRFPETLSAVDFEGRTALHYAAVIPDNGYYYNLMQQLGANAKDLDDNGNSAEDYLRNSNLFPYEQLLNDYGISHDIAQNMLSDKGKNLMSNGHMDIPVFHTEEGRYLAKSLGDPLIKGLTEVANIKPKDPVAFLATFLHNFPENEKPRLNTQESIIMTSEAPEVENDHAVPESPPLAASPAKVRSATRTATRPNRPIDVITLDPKTGINSDAPEMAFSSISRDEHGQSMLHFAAARTHANNALFQLLQESDVSLGYRDELYRTARDVSIQANVPENTVEIDKWVLHLAARGKSEKIMELLLQGYDHILDIGDAEGVTITEVVTKRGDIEMSNLLKSIPAFEESREALHSAVRQGNLSSVQNMVKAEGGATLAGAHNSFGRTALHIAVLAQHEDIVAYLAETFPELLRIGDNLERTPLHYAMGVEKIESLSRVLIRAGSKRVLKDLKGRQPSYYFMNKSDILRLKEEEESY